jgi:thiol-disulfide isomerase/thioredoxin
MNTSTNHWHWSGKLLIGLLLATSVGVEAEQVVAPGFEIPGVDRNIRLSDYRGKIVYLDFWASWCVPCRQSFPWMEQMHQKYRSQGLEVIAINLDKERKLAETFIQHYSNSFTIGYDIEGVVPLAYEVRGMPSSFVIDQDGVIVSSHIGFNGHKQKEYEADILRLLNTNRDHLTLETSE